MWTQEYCAEEKRAYALADNRIAQNAGWDRELLAIEFGELSLLLPDLRLEIGDLGFSTGELDGLLSDHTDEDSSDPADHVTTEPAQRLVTRRGDLWRLCYGVEYEPRVVDTAIVVGRNSPVVT